MVSELFSLGIPAFTAVSYLLLLARHLIWHTAAHAAHHSRLSPFYRKECPETYDDVKNRICGVFEVCAKEIIANHQAPQTHEQTDDSQQHNDWFLERIREYEGTNYTYNTNDQVCPVFAHIEPPT